MSDTINKLGGWNLHERIIDSHDKNITSFLQFLVIDVTWDMTVGTRRACQNVISTLASKEL
jgi:hypothetical protein